MFLKFAPPAFASRSNNRELGADYFDRYRTEQLKRRNLAQLQRLGYQVTLTPVSPLPKEDSFRTGTAAITWTIPTDTFQRLPA